MKRSTSYWLITAAVLIVAGLVLFAGVMSANAWDFKEIGLIGYETRTLDINEKFDSISIQSDTADIQFLPSEDGQCHIVLLEQQKVKHSISVKNSTLTIEVEDERKWYEYITILSSSPKITIYLPQAEHTALSIEEKTGDVAIPKGFAFGSIRISASTGDIACAASASGLISIKTSTGDIRIENLHAGEAQLSITTGKVEMYSVSCDGNITINVDTGKTILSDVACNSILSKGSTGRITFTNVIAKETIEITRSTGDVKLDGCDAASLTITTGTGSVSGTLFSEKTFITRTSTGRVRVPETTASGICRVTTSTGNITFSVQ